MVIIRNRKRRLSLLGRLIHRLSPAAVGRLETRLSRLETRKSKGRKHSYTFSAGLELGRRWPGWLGIFYWLSRLARCMLIVRHSKNQHTRASIKRCQRLPASHGAHQTSHSLLYRCCAGHAAGMRRRGYWWRLGSEHY